MIAADRAPLVSVIIPAYNAAETIVETLNSVIAQTFPRWEAIVADDGSTDATVPLVEAIAARDSRIKLVQIEKNTGLPACARNVALGYARGKWIAFLDADDLWKRNKLAVQLHAFRETGRAWGFSNSRFFGGGAAHPDGIKYPRGWRPRPPFFPALFTGDGVPFLTVMAKREILQRISPDGILEQLFDEDRALKAVEDWDVALRLAKIEEPAYVPRALAQYRAHPGGISKRSDANLHARLSLIDKHRRLGAPERFCQRAENLQQSKYAVDLLFEGRANWRSLIVQTCLRPPVSPRGAFLASLALWPAPVARALYRAALGMRRRG